MKQIIYGLLVISACSFISCNSKNKRQIQKSETTMEKGTYGFDKEFLSNYTEVIELKNANAAVLLTPAWQGRVMTSTCNGDAGFSFGWMNYDLIQKQKFVEYFNPFGGEERFWIGPEGGQFSVYFEKGKEFDIANWYVPAGIDTEAFEVVSNTETSADFRKQMMLTNYSGTRFNFEVNRKVKLLDENIAGNNLGIDLKGISMVAYQSDNSIKNRGAEEWTKENGLLSIWMLGMFIPSPEVTVVVPVKEGDANEIGVKVNDNYFGEISDDRLKVNGNTIYFKADGKSRGKIGIPPLRSKGVMGSFDAENTILTILECEIPENVSDFVNSAWEIQEEPYSGDALNSYNDGPLEDGSQMGPFYELESSSPALALKPNEAYTHSQRTYHFKGEKAALNNISLKVLGVGIADIENAF